MPRRGCGHRQVFQFPLHEEPGSPDRQQARHADSRRMGPMGSAECVVYVDLRKVGQLPRELRAVGFLFGMEAQVFQQQNFPGAEPGCQSFSLCPDAIRSLRHRLPQQLFQALSHRGQAHLCIWLTFRAAQMRSEHERRPLREDRTNCRQRHPNARVAGNGSTRFLVEGNVEVHPHEHALVAQVDLVDGVEAHVRPVGGETARSRRPSSGDQAASLETRSTTRLE